MCPRAAKIEGIMHVSGTIHEGIVSLSSPTERGDYAKKPHEQPYHLEKKQESETSSHIWSQANW